MWELRQWGARARGVFVPIWCVRPWEGTRGPSRCVEKRRGEQLLPLNHRWKWGVYGRDWEGAEMSASGFEIARCILQGHLNVVIHSFIGPQIMHFTHFQVHLVLQEHEPDHTHAASAPPITQGPQGSTHLEKCCLLLVVQ